MTVFSIIYQSIDHDGELLAQCMIFDNKDQHAVWAVEMERIKKEAGNMPPGNGPSAKNIWTHWLAKCQEFETKWGRSRVPFDICYAVNDVLVNLFNREPFYETTPNS